MNLAVGTVVGALKEKKLFSKTKTSFYKCVTNYSKHFSEKKCHKSTEGKGARLHIFMRDVSAERSEISRRVEYLQNTIVLGDRNF